MPKSQLNETESLDDKIKRIRKKNEEIERRRLEVEADKQTAAKLNALVQLSAPKEDWPPPRSFTIIEEDKERQPNNKQENTRDRNRGNVTSGDSVYEGKKPPPDPAYRFLADDDRDPLPTKRSSRYHQSPPRRGQAASRSRGRGNKMNAKDNPPVNVRNTPGYEAWREERNRIDEERIRRQRTAQGQWRREWDSQKSENDWQPSHEDKSVEHNPSQKSAMGSKVPSESAQKKLIPRTKEEPKSESTKSGNIAGKIPNFLSGIKVEPLQKNYFVSHQKSDEDTKTSLTFGKNIGKNAASPFTNQAQPMKVHAPPNDSRVVQNSGSSLQISFGSDSLSQKVPQRRAGSGRLGPPAPATGHPPRRSAAAPAATASGLARGGRADGLPQRRARRRIAAPPQRKSSSTGDDSWEDADEHSEGERGGGGKAANPKGAALKSGALKTPTGVERQRAHDKEEGGEEEEEGGGVETTTNCAISATTTTADASSSEGKAIPRSDDDAPPSPHPDDITQSSVQCDSVLGAQNSDTRSITIPDDNTTPLHGTICDVGVKEDNVLSDDEVDEYTVGDPEGEYVPESPDKGGDMGECDTAVGLEGESQLHDFHATDEIESASSANNVSDLVESNDNVCEEVDGGRVGGEEKDPVAVDSASITDTLEEDSTCVPAEAKTVVEDNKEIESTVFVGKDEPTDLRIVESIESENAKYQESGAENNATHGKVSVQNESIQVITTSGRENPENLTCHPDDSSGETEVTPLASKQFEDKSQDQTTLGGTINASDVEENVISDLGAVSSNTCDSVITTEATSVPSNIDKTSFDHTQVQSNSQDEYSLKSEVQVSSEGLTCTAVLEREESEIIDIQNNLSDCPNTNKPKMSLPDPENNCEIDNSKINCGNDDPSTSKNETKENTELD